MSICTIVVNIYFKVTVDVYLYIKRKHLFVKRQ